MKSEPFQFSPTSAGVRIDHLNLQQSNKNTSCDNKTSSFINTSAKNNINKTTFSLPRARATPSTTSSCTTTIPEEKGHFLEPNHIIIHNPCIDPTTIKTGKNSFTPQRGAKKSSNKMRNCLAVVGVTVILGLLSFVLLVECRSFKGHSKKQYDAEISSESRIQDDSFQEPDPESSEEHPTKVVATTFSSKDSLPLSSTSSVSSSTAKSSSSSSTTKRASGTIPTSAGRLTRSRVSVICKGGHSGVLEEDLSSTTSASSSSTTKKSHKKHDSINLPTFLPRETDDAEEDEDEEGGERNQWDDEDNDATLSSEESQGQVITVTGYSQVSGGKPEAKSLVKSASNTAIKYVPKPKKRKSQDSDDDDSSSSEEEIAEVVTTAKPKAHGSGGHNKQHRSSKSQKASHKAHAETTSSRKNSEEPSTTHKASAGEKKSKHSHRHSKRESTEEDDDEEVATTTTRAPKRSSKHSSKKSSKHSGSSLSKDSPVRANTENNNEKGDSGETEEESLFPTFRNSKSDGKRARKAERKQKAAPLVPVATAVDSDLESAEAEPDSVVSNLRKTEASTSSTSSKRSSRSRKLKSSTSVSNNDAKKEAPSVKPVTAEEISSEELNMEEMPYSTHESNSKKSKSRRSSSSSSRNSRMSSRTAAPKQRTGTFSSIEIDD